MEEIGRHRSTLTSVSGDKRLSKSSRIKQQGAFIFASSIHLSMFCFIVAILDSGSSFPTSS